MADVDLHTSQAAASGVVNVALRLAEMARRRPQAIAVAEPAGRGRYRQLTFAELDKRSQCAAAGLARLGVRPEMRIALLVPPSIDFFAAIFALFKVGATTILIDPGMGRRNLLRCLDESRPEGFVAIPIVHAVRRLLGKRYAASKHNVVVGRSLLGGTTFEQLAGTSPEGFEIAKTQASDPAAIIFTTGSTGPPKGVLYRHGNFDRQVEEIQQAYGIQEGEIDLPCFPLFGLFNAAMGVTTVIPQMDPTRPARVDPRKILAAVRQWQVTQSFGSPAVWRRVGTYCAQHNERMPTLRRVLSAGAPVPEHVLRTMKQCIADDGLVHTPYGATEALPVASIEAGEVMRDTWPSTVVGQGVCVGRRFPGIDWQVVRIVDGPIARIEQAEPLAAGEIGELIVRGPVVTTEYVTRVEANAAAKIVDGAGFWHRMGDVGYLDAQDRFWFCGRLAHRVTPTEGPMYTIRCEAIFNQHPRVARSALVGIGKPGQQTPVMIVELHRDKRLRGKADIARFWSEIRQLGAANELTRSIEHFLDHPAFPVDIRHNAKIFREKLAVWAARRLQVRS